jgi:uncharacterized protein (DUF58 family)
MTTRSFWILSAVIALMVAGGLLTVRGELLALALPLMLYLVIGVFFAPGEQKLRVERVLSTDRVTQGMDFAVKIQVTNENARVEELHLSEGSEFQYQNLEGETSKVTRLDAGASVQYEYTIQGWRGSYRFKNLLAREVDPFGLFEIQEQLPAPGEVLVYPTITNLKPIPIRPPQTKGFSGPISSRKSGTGMDFFGVRQYHLGDSLRHVNWKKSVRHTTDLFTNEYEQERIADVGLILDARPLSDITFRGKRLFEYSIQATASLAEMFLTEGHCLSLLVYSTAIQRVFPGYGKVQKERILRALANAETGINYAMEHLRYFPARLLPPRGQLVYISPLAASDLEPLLRFRASGYHLLVINPDPLFFEQQEETENSQPDYKLATRFAKVERNLLYGRLHRAGIQVVNWKVNQPLSAALDQIHFQKMLQQRTLGLFQ